MSLLTTIYKFIKPELTDSPPDITVMNQNWDRLDAKLKEIEDTDATHQADETQHVPYAVASGSVNTYVVTLSPAPDAYIDGFAIAIKINVNNTGVSTVNVNGLGAKDIKKPNGNDVSAGNLKAGSIYTMRYNGTNFILQGSDAAGNATPADILSGKTATTDAGDITGIIPIKAAQTYTPTTTDQTIATGQYLSGAQTVKGDANLISANILNGKSIFNVAGSAVNGSGMKKYATGNYTVTNESVMCFKKSGDTVSLYYVLISGLTFIPRLIIIQGTTTKLQTTLYFINNFNADNNYNLLMFETTFLSMSNLYVNSTGFKLPVGVSNDTVVTWYAWE